MAKMFYTLEEVCQKLGKTEDDLKEMVSSGQIQEFRDRDKLMFKVEQIDLLASSDEDASEVHLDLEESAGSSGLALESEASALGLTDSREGTGVSVFDTDHAGEDAAEGTHAGEAVEEELSLDAVGSGSGLLDLTRESDETSLGAELLEEVYAGDENVEIPAHASGLFEAAGTESPGDAAAAEPTGMTSMPVVIEAYDGGGSGLGAGLLLGALAALVCVAIIAIVGVTGATPALAQSFASSLWLWFGGLLGLTVVLGLVGLFVGKASE